jgi:hypothetical protein
MGSDFILIMPNKINSTIAFVQYFYLNNYLIPKMDVLRHMISAQMAATKGEPVAKMFVRNRIPVIEDAQIYTKAFVVAQKFGNNVRVYETGDEPVFSIMIGKQEIFLEDSDFDELRTRLPDLSKQYDISGSIESFVYSGNGHEYTNDTFYGLFLHTSKWKGSDVFVYAYVWEHKGTTGISYCLSPFEITTAVDTPRAVADAASALLQNVTVWRRYVMVPSARRLN